MILIKIGLKTARDETDVAKLGEKNQRLARETDRAAVIFQIFEFLWGAAAEFLEIKSTFRGSTTYSRNQKYLLPIQFDFNHWLENTFYAK